MSRNRKSSEQVVRTAPRPCDIAVVRGKGDDDNMATVSGLAVPWSTPTRLFGDVHEQFERGSIKPESYTKAKGADYDARLNLAHDQGRSIATVGSTLDFADDEDGLRFEATVDLRDPDAQAAVLKIERGDYSNASIEFRYGGPGFAEERTEREDGSVL